MLLLLSCGVIGKYTIVHLMVSEYNNIESLMNKCYMGSDLVGAP